MKLITFATYREAEATLQLFNAKQETETLYTSPIGLIAITGMGPYNTANFLKTIHHPISHILNIGLAGALKEELLAESIYSIGICSHHGSNLAPLVLKNEGLHLATCDVPQYTTLLQDRYDLVDMEGYSVAAFAKAHSIPCEIIKLISDHCTHMTAQKIRANMKHYSEIIANFLKIGYT